MSPMSPEGKAGGNCVDDRQQKELEVYIYNVHVHIHLSKQDTMQDNASLNRTPCLYARQCLSKRDTMWTLCLYAGHSVAKQDIV